MILPSINLTMEGPEANDRRLELSVFAEKIKQFQQLLVSSLKSSGRDDVVINIVYLSCSSPAVVECQPVVNGKPDIAAVQGYKEILDCIESEKADALNNDTLTTLEKLAKPAPKKIGWGRIEIAENDVEDKTVYALDEQFFNKLKHARSKEHAEISTIDGILEEINIHGEPPHTCRIYGAGTASTTIKCVFSTELLERVQAALGRDVFVSGEFVYRPGDSAPYEIRVYKIDILPPSEKLPSLGDLKGIAPGLTGDKTPEEFIRELRNSWGRDG